ncbi:hypothetical protein DFA_00191 [Cavenderia fasciculata]|uniref:Uncharacterized protein n=1 Tax=Cavenderia fasciculata TaxID=261658 RepID=F4PXV3_CACFS|nr:uncharacterized protein DFA_00191 [Cavenderia fasciculata]EGG19613.1 hypothetical protein DFA_00191 [Cavenderia fasciculata]|eukprot:XP_004357907.1 hypothetical protein DFA_00191 [Cavenderia fasciculata]
MTLQILGRQKNKNNDEKVKTKIDETLFRRVWNNIVLQRLICSKIKDYLSKEDRVALITGPAKVIERYKADPSQFIKSNNNSILSLFYCECLTVDLCMMYFDTYCSKVPVAAVIDALSVNRRSYIDTWLFRRAFDIFKDRGIKPESMTSIYTWRNVIKSNNVEFYNYAKSVLPMLERHHFLDDLVPIATQPENDPWSKSVHRLPGTDLLAQLLDDLIDLDPTENWLERVNFSYLAENGLVDILETIHKHAGSCIPMLVKPKYISKYQSQSGRQLNEHTMMVAIQNKQINSIRCLYKVFNIPLSHANLMLVARTCDLPFIIALHNIEPEAGRLYTIFLHVVSFNFGLHFPPNDPQCYIFRKEFIDHVKPLNFINKILEQQINTDFSIGKWPRIKYQPRNAQHHFTIFQQSGDDTNIPSLSFD